MKSACIVRFGRRVATLWLCAVVGTALAQSVALDPALRERIDAFIEGERQASGIPGIALAVVQRWRA